MEIQGGGGLAALGLYREDGLQTPGGGADRILSVRLLTSLVDDS